VTLLIKLSVYVGNINALGLIKRKFGTESIAGFVSSFNNVVEPGNRLIVLIDVEC
jgi:hypothetical protein